MTITLTHNKMVKKIILAVTMVMMTTTCFAEMRYVYIEKKGLVEKGQEAGQNETGDVIAVAPFTPQYKPTPSELSRYQVIVMDLTDNEVNNLLEEEKNGEAITRARKRKIDLDSTSVKNIKQEQVLNENQKTAVLGAISVKPALLSE